jgi:hypothetical protein
MSVGGGLDHLASQTIANISISGMGGMPSGQGQQAQQAARGRSGGVTRWPSPSLPSPSLQGGGHETLKSVDEGLLLGNLSVCPLVGVGDGVHVGGGVGWSGSTGGGGGVGVLGVLGGGWKASEGVGRGEGVGVKESGWEGGGRDSGGVMLGRGGGGALLDPLRIFCDNCCKLGHLSSACPSPQQCHVCSSVRHSKKGNYLQQQKKNSKPQTGHVHRRSSVPFHMWLGASLEKG